jgi:hypothetical protein
LTPVTPPVLHAQAKPYVKLRQFHAIIGQLTSAKPQKKPCLAIATQTVRSALAKQRVKHLLLGAITNLTAHARQPRTHAILIAGIVIQALVHYPALDVFFGKMIDAEVRLKPQNSRSGFVGDLVFKVGLLLNNKRRLSWSI